MYSAAAAPEPDRSPLPAGSHANPVRSTPPGYAWRSGIYISQTLRPQEPEHLLQALPVLATIDARFGSAGRATKTISEPSRTDHPARRFPVGHFASCPVGPCPIVPGIAMCQDTPFRSWPCPTALEPALPKTRSPELARNPWNCPFSTTKPAHSSILPEVRIDVRVYDVTTGAWHLKP